MRRNPVCKHPIPVQPSELREHCRLVEAKCAALTMGPYCSHYLEHLSEAEKRVPNRLAQCVRECPTVEPRLTRPKKDRRHRTYLQLLPPDGTSCIDRSRHVCPHLEQTRFPRCGWHGDDLTRANHGRGWPVKCADCLREGAPAADAAE